MSEKEKPRKVRTKTDILTSYNSTVKKRLTPGRFSREGRAGLFLSLRAGGSIPRFEAGEGYNCSRKEIKVSFE